MRTILLLALVSTLGCTEQVRAKSFGGTLRTDLPADRKLVNVTWKEANMWVLTRPMRPEERAESYEFRESSSFGMMQGTIVITEHNGSGRVEAATGAK